MTEASVEVTPVQIGDVVKVVDEVRVEHSALVCAVHGEFGGTYVPCINVVYLATEENKRDPWGRQVERLSSLQHLSQGPNGMPTPGRYWVNL